MACGAAPARTLDEPLNDKPTVGSEINRGFEAAFNCVMANLADAQKTSDCDQAVVQAEEQKHADSDPFKLGLYYGACVHFATEIRSDTEGQATNRAAADDLTFAKIELKFTYQQFKLVRDAVGISDDHLIDATKMVPEGRAGAKRELLEWEQHPPGA
jgi:hypothetical protein